MTEQFEKGQLVICQTPIGKPRLARVASDHGGDSIVYVERWKLGGRHGTGWASARTSYHRAFVRLAAPSEIPEEAA